jgi:hypothetical protein
LERRLALTYFIALIVRSYCSVPYRPTVASLPTGKVVGCKRDAAIANERVVNQDLLTNKEVIKDPSKYSHEPPKPDRRATLDCRHIMVKGWVHLRLTTRSRSRIARWTA